MKEIRDIWSAVIAHYAKLLEYDDVAEAAINIKADKSVAAADEFAAFQMAQLQTIELIANSLNWTNNTARLIKSP